MSFLNSSIASVSDFTAISRASSIEISKSGSLPLRASSGPCGSRSGIGRLSTSRSGSNVALNRRRRSWDSCASSNLSELRAAFRTIILSLTPLLTATLSAFLISLNASAFSEIKKALKVAVSKGVKDKIIVRNAALNSLKFDEAQESHERLRRFKATLLPDLDVESLPIPERLPQGPDDARNGRDPLFEISMDEAREIAVKSLTEAIDEFKKLIKLPGDLNYLEGLIFSQQSRLKPILSVVVPLGLF